MAKVEVYTTNWCPYCNRAKGLLKKLGQEYEETNIENDDSKRDEMIKRAGGARTVPQIFIDGKHVGGCDELHGLHSSGKLEKMLKS